MCLIIVKESGIDLPKERHLKNGETKNSDGIGIAYLKNGEHLLTIKKDFKTFSGFYTFISDNIKKEDFLIVHFRNATSGLVDEGNRHPFPVINDKEKIRATNLSCEMIMAHNGVLTQFSSSCENFNLKKPKEKFSDTQKFVLEVLSSSPVKNNIDSPAIQILINDFLNGDRLVTLDAQKNIWYFGTWEKEDGILYSNKSYETSIAHYKRKGFYYYNEEDINHWSSFNRPQLPFYKKDKECEYCQATKKVKDVKIEELTFTLCKRCRKKWYKGKITLEEITKEKRKDEKEIETELIEKISKEESKKEEEKIKCSSCLLHFPKNELKYIMGSEFLVCEDCYDQIEDCYKPVLN